MNKQQENSTGQKVLNFLIKLPQYIGAIIKFGNYIPFYTKIKKNQVKGGFLRLPSIPQIF